jgi:hypothetical protein
MKRSMGVFALFAVLAAGARLGLAPSAPKTGKTSSTPLAYLPGDLTDVRTTCSEFADQSNPKDPNTPGGILTLVDRYLYGTPEPPAGSRLLPEGIKFIVATLPDPLHTHLNLQFDRTIEAVQQAVQDQGYTYDSSWLPWKQRAAEYSSRAEQSAEEEQTSQRERCPGLILFRRSIQQPTTQASDDTYTKGLFVFLVAEKPTTGVNRIQWNNAVSWIEKHADSRAQDGTLRVLGPTFSGSGPSMVRALVDLGKQGNFTNILLYTGTIRGCSAYRWLNDELDKTTPIPVRTADFDENDAIQIDRYFRYLKQRGHSLSEVAILSEDETAYGGLADSHPNSDDKGTSDPSSRCDPADDGENRPLHLYYPRDISALRSAYEEQSIFSPSTPDASSTAHPVLQPQSTSSTHDDTDTIATFSGSNSALAQEAQLYGVVDSLRTHGIRFVILRSTSTLDYLFLTRFLHRAYAEVFIVTMGPDILFGREIDSTEFRGVAALTAFPLLPRGQDWTAATGKLPRHAHRVFGSDSMEGVYLAVRFLINDVKTSRNEDRPYVHPGMKDIPDYRPPRWADIGSEDPRKPPTWLSVVGRNGYWPLAVLTDPSSVANPIKSNLASVAVLPQGSSDQSPDQGLSLSPAWKVCCMLAVLVIVAHFFACRYGWKFQNLSMLVQFTPLPGRRQLFLISFGWATLGSVLILMFLCSARIRMGSYLQPMNSLWVFILGLFALLACLATGHDIGSRSGREPGPAHMRLSVWIIFPFLLLGLMGWAGLSIFDYFGPNGLPTAYRAVHLTSGVSPMVSLLLMASGFYWWFWQTFSGLALLGGGRPILPRHENIPRELARISDEMAKNIESFAIPLPRFSAGRGVFYILPLGLLALQFCALRPSSALSFETVLHSLENTAFNATLHLMFAVAFYLLMIECVQLVSTWLSLKRLLLALNRTPLRRTFSALQGLSMQSLWSMSGTSSRARYTIFSHQQEALHHLRNVIRSFAVRHEGYDRICEAVDSACESGRAYVEKRCGKADLAMVNDQDSQQIREVFCRCAEQILNQLILPQWSGETSTLDLAESGERTGSKAVLPLSDKEPIRRAEEFVCLIYVGYLQNLVARMRTMVLSIVGLFAAIAFSLAFYPYTPRPAIVLSLLFILLALGSLVALVYAGLARDTTLSYITNTEPGELGLDFWIRLASFIGVPLAGLLAAQFPGITDFVVSWIEPSLNAVK